MFINLVGFSVLIALVRICKFWWYLEEGNDIFYLRGCFCCCSWMLLNRDVGPRDLINSYLKIPATGINAAHLHYMQIQKQQLQMFWQQQMQQMEQVAGDFVYFPFFFCFAWPFHFNRFFFLHVCTNWYRLLSYIIICIMPWRRPYWVGWGAI